MLLNLFFLGFGIILLLVGGAFLVKATVFLAKYLEKQVFFISLVLLGMVSSAPELFVTLQSHFKLETDIAAGNIIGSNIFNILVVGSFIILTQTKIANKNIVIKNTFFLLIATLVSAFLVLDGSLSRLNGFALLLLFGVFFTKPFIPSHIETQKEHLRKQNPYLLVFLIILGFGFLFLGAHLTIESSVFIAESFNISRRIIGLFVVSIGTSLPELTIGLMALLKKKSDVALGSIIGSNIFNTFFIPGVASLAFSFPISTPLIKIDGSFMWIAELVLLFYLIGEKYLPRKIAAISFIFFYICYCTFVLMPALS